jgi:ribonuclease D
MSDPGERRLVADETTLHAVLDAASRHDRYALDTEFHGERTYHAQLALVQIAYGDEVVLVDPLAVDVRALAPLLDGDATLIAHAGDQDLAILQRRVGVTPRRYFDTQVAAGFCGLGVPSLANLTERLAGVKLRKGDRLTDWTRRPLTPDQLAYAGDDVAYLLQLADALEDRLQHAGRLEWACDECEERRRRDRTRAEPDTAWWRLKGSRQLRGKSRGVAQCVTAWRERRAERLDTPPRYVLSDLALAGIIARPPTSRDELANIRGLDGRVLREPIVHELLDAVARGLALPADELRLPPREEADRGLAPAVSVIAAWLSQHANELGLEPSLLATRADLVELLNTGGGRLAHGWRADTVGEPIRQLMDGRAVLALGDHGRKLVLQSATPT